MSIQVRSLTKKYNEQVAVNAISFDIPSGQVVGFLGPNGAGKSTTMKILTGFISATSGDAEICGIHVEKSATKAKACIGYLPEHNPLYLDMYVKEYLIFMGKLSGLKKDVNERVKAMINLTGLDVEQAKKIGQLSKGYRQRVGLAQALLHNPEVLILDEPTSGLDPNQVTEIRKIIREIGKDRTVMLSTHVMQEVEAMCDRVIIINKGSIVADDTIRNLQNNNTSKVLVVKFKNTVQINQLKSLSGVKQVENLKNNTFKITAEKEYDLQEKLFHFAVNSSNIILEQKEQEQSLESVFRSFTAE